MSNKQKNFIEDGLSNDDIILNVKNIIKRRNEDEIKQLKEPEMFEKLHNEFNKFYTRYPMLFEMAIRNDNFPWENLNYMLNMRNKIINNEMTAEGASKIVGQQWYEKYVDINEGHQGKKRKK